MTLRRVSGAVFGIEKGFGDAEDFLGCFNRFVGGMKMRINPVLAALAVLVPSAAQAQSADKRFWLQGMVYRPSIQTTAEVSVPGNDGSSVDFEETFRFPRRETLPSFTAGARLGRNWRMIGEFYSLDRQRTAILDEEVKFDGVTYPVDAEVTARLGSDIYRFTVGYSFINNPKFEMGASLGAHVTSFIVALEGEATVGGTTTPLEATRRRLLAPLPTAGLYAEWRPMDRLVIGAKADSLSIKIDDFRGRLLNLQASASYEVIDNLAIGVAWRRVRYRIDVDREDWTGQLRYRFDGPAAFLEWRFG
jgi:hypothetical protein